MAKNANIENPVSDSMDKKVKIYLPREKRDQEDAVVWVNERRYLIKRGVQVEVPEAVALILQDQEAALQHAIDFVDRVRN